MKHISVITIILTLLALPHIGCVSPLDYKTTKEPIDVVSHWPTGKQNNAEVLEVIKKTGDSVVFPEESPGKIQNKAVIGNKIERKRVSIEKSSVTKTSLRSGDNTLAVETITGDFYVLESFEIGDSIISGYSTTFYKSIPFSDIDWLWIKRVHNTGERALSNLVQSYGSFWFYGIAFGLLGLLI